MQEAINKLEKATVSLCRHPETCAYAGVMLMGQTTVVDNIPTACTDGVNERYGADFLMRLAMPEVRAIKLHEGLHKVLKHTVRGLPYWKKSPKLANMAADYVVNDIIVNLKDKEFIRLPAGALIDSAFHGWSFPEIFRALEKEQEEKEQEEKGGRRGDPLDEHDMSHAQEMSAQEAKEYVQQINEAIHQGGMLAGRFGHSMPRTVLDSALPDTDWITALREYVSSFAHGESEHTYRRFDKRLILDDVVVPGVIGEKVGDIILACDMSGSITQDVQNEVLAEVQALCEQVQPDALRVLWWDTTVRGEQVFTPEAFSDIRKLLKPVGGGGTRVSSVSEHIVERGYKCDCLIVLTDGHVESDIDWRVTAPTLWLVTARKNFTPPNGGKLVKVN